MENTFVLKEESSIIDKVTSKQETDFLIEVKHEPLECIYKIENSTDSTFIESDETLGNGDVVAEEAIECPLDVKLETPENMNINVINLENEEQSVKQFTCFTCSYRSKSRNKFKIHVNNHNKGKQMKRDSNNFYIVNNSNKRYHCALCKYKNNYLSQIKMHTTVHTKEKPYCCNVCHYRARLKGQLKEHMKIHLIVKPYGCSLCNYRSTQADLLRLHMTIHTNEKPYLCSVCDYKTARPHNLKSHILRRHTLNKIYFCNKCDYKCNISSDLRAHVKEKHTYKLHKYNCCVCNYKASRIQCLKVHMIRHTVAMPYNCSVCNYKTADVSNLNIHIMNNHECNGNLHTFRKKLGLLLMNVITNKEP